MAQPPNVLPGPEPVETADLHFKLYCKLKVFETETKYEEGYCGILAVSQYYGAIFVGNCNGFSVIQTKTLNPAVDCEKFPKRDVVLNLKPTHISVDFTQKFLAVVCTSRPGSVLIFYNIQSFSTKDVAPLKITPISKAVQNMAAVVVDLMWQPNADGSLMICMSDGSVLAFSQGPKEGPVFTLPSTIQATCFCWSPKGKQIVIGSAKGTLSQYKPDLKVVKTLPPPPLFNGAAMIVSVLWISSYQFAVAYNDRANPESFPVITIVNAAKNEPVNVINYDDITYSSTIFRNHQIYMTHQSTWNLIFVSSANSIEVAVLHSKDNSSWQQWLLGDASRAELPLNPDRQETFPLGLAFDFTSQDTIPWGEGTLPPMPRLLLISDEGILCVFNVVNATENAPQLCAPPKENLDDSLFVSSTKVAPGLSEPSKPAQNIKGILGSPPAFGDSKLTYTFEFGSGFGGFGAAKPPSTAPEGTPTVFQQQQGQQQPQIQPQQLTFIQSTQQQQPTPVTQVHQQQQPTPVTQVHQQQQPTPVTQVHQQQQPTPVTQVHQQQQPTPITQAHQQQQPTPVTQVHQQQQPTPVTQAHQQQQPTPITQVHQQQQPTPVTQAHQQQQPTPITQVHQQQQPTPVTQAHQQQQPTPITQVHQQHHPTPVTQVHQQHHPTPVTQAHQQQQQPPSTPQQQPQQQQLLIFSTPTPSSTTAFKVPQFGTSTFTFGTTSSPVLRLKSGNAVVTNADTQPVSLTVKPAPAPAPAPAAAPAQVEIFIGRTVPQSTPIKQSEVTIERTTVQPVQVIKKPEEVESKGKTEEASAQGESPKLGTPELAAVDDSVYLNALQEEIEHFNSELQQLSAKFGTLDSRVGFDEDKLKMKKSIDSLNEFWKELKETTEAQRGEINAVVMDLMESFAWLEDAKSRNLQRKNPSYIELKKSEELDPLSARHMNEIAHLKYYIENQLKQLTSHLEKEWMNHQENYRNEVKSRMTVPPLEEVYKTIHFQLKILHKQKLLVEELREKHALKKRKNRSQRFISLTNDPVKAQKDGNGVSELSKLAQNLLQLNINEEDNSPHSKTWGIMKSQLQVISERSKKLNREKRSALRDVLSECGMVKIRPVKTTFGNSSFLRSLALEKAASKAAKEKLSPKPVEPNLNGKVSAINTNVVDSPKMKLEATLKPKPEKPKIENKPPVSKAEASKSGIFSSEKAPPVPLTVQPVAKPEVKSSQSPLSKVVSNVGKKPEAKPQPAFVFGGSNFQKPEPVKEVIVVSVKSDQKAEEQKATPVFTFGVSEPGESIFGKKEPTVFGAKPVFGFTASTPIMSTKPNLPAPNVTITPVTATAATTSASPFTFTAPTTVAASTDLPKMNLLFSGKEQSSDFSTPATSGSFFSVSSGATQSSASSNFELSMFGSGNKTSTTSLTSSSSFFGVPKTTSEPPSQSSSFIFNQPVENKSPTPTNATVATPIKSTPETEDVDVLKVDEPVKKPETPAEKSKDSPKTTSSPSSFPSLPAPAKTVPEVTSPSTPTNVSLVSTPQSSATTTNVFSKTEAAKAAIATAAETSTACVVNTSTVTAVTMSSVFTFSVGLTSNAFGQTATTATATTTMSLFGTPATTTDVFGQVSSTTPTTNIFGGSTPTTPTSNIFGASTPTKPIFGQAATTPTTTTKNIFGATTPTTNAFGQVSTPSTPTTFGQKSDSVAQTANLFGQLLSDSNQSVFGTTSTTTTTAANIFSTPKNIFGGVANTTPSTVAALFGTTSSVFPQTTSVFGQATTASSVFGQPQTSTTNSIFGQNICSSFGGGTAVTSNQSEGFSKPDFGQNVFGHSTNNTSLFGGSTTASLFGGTSSTTSGNVFQTTTTSTAFGSTTPGPFSGGASSFGETSFGSPSNTFQKPLGGFGSPPVFGGGPAFGGSPTFGGSPSFGSPPTFGSMSQGTFGQSTGSTTFENLANQNTVGFENLAQQSQTQGFGTGFGSSTFENKPAFGGNSFSSWRSK